MPTRRRTTSDTTIERTSAITYLLMIGQTACPIWLDGWYVLDVELSDEHDRVRRECWPREAAALTADAKRYGFVPWGKSGREPHGPGVERWKADYIAVHGKHPATGRRTTP